MNILKTWNGKNALLRCEKECQETIVVPSKENIERIELVALPENLNMFIVYFTDKAA